MKEELTRPPIRREPPLLPLRWRLLHWGPIGAMSIVACICITSSYCHLMWWPPGRSVCGLIDLLVFLLWNYLCLANFLRAAYVGPGYVPLGWKPVDPNDQAKLQQCEKCEGFKTPRSHHCSKCRRCVMKMDHHCPWINNCCGHMNHGYFIAFLLSAVIGCVHATVILGASVYWAVFRVYYFYYGTGREPKVELGIYGLFAAIFAFGLAIGVIVAVGFLFVVQMRSVLRNKTGIEEYIVRKANGRERDDQFVYPYDLGWKANLRQVFTMSLEPLSDGITWPVKDGCDQYTLTVEQLEQKQLKRCLAAEYEVVKRYNGNWWLSSDQGGCRAMFSTPCFMDESLLKAEVGDRLLVTRWRRHWLYGAKKVVDGQEANGTVHDIKKDQRGWFPRRCVKEVDERDQTEQDANGDSSGNPANGQISSDHAKDE